MDNEQIEALEMAYDEAAANLRDARAAYEAAQDAHDEAKAAYDEALRQPAWRYPDSAE